VNERPAEENVDFGTHSRRKRSTGDHSGKYPDEIIHQVKARLRPGQYFGEVTSLSLAPRRTATVRSIPQ